MRSTTTHSATVRSQVSVDPGTKVDCSIQVLNSGFDVVGWKVVHFPASTSQNNTYTTDLKTMNRRSHGLDRQVLAAVNSRDSRSRPATRPVSVFQPPTLRGIGATMSNAETTTWLLAGGLRPTGRRARAPSARRAATRSSSASRPRAKRATSRRTAATTPPKTSRRKIEARIRTLTNLLKTATIVGEAPADTGIVGPGMRHHGDHRRRRVDVRARQPRDRRARQRPHRLQPERSPLGEAISGSKVGDDDHLHGPQRQRDRRRDHVGRALQRLARHDEARIHATRAGSWAAVVRRFSVQTVSVERGLRREARVAQALA